MIEIRQNGTNWDESADLEPVICRDLAILEKGLEARPGYKTKKFHLGLIK